MSQNNINILFIGDIVGSLGRRTVREFLPELRRKHNINVVIANGENSAHGTWITW